MADTGWVLGSAAATSGSGLSVNWSNPANVLTADDGTYASASLSLFSSSSYALQVTGFDFSGVPEGSAINGIEARLRRYNGASADVEDDNIRLMVGGAAAGTNKAVSDTPWPMTIANADYGGPADLWGLTPTAAQVKAANFGISIMARRDGGSPQPRIATVWLRVTYTPAGFNHVRSRHSGSWMSPDVRARHAGTWKPVNGIWVRRSGSWVKVLERS